MRHARQIYVNLARPIDHMHGYFLISGELLAVILYWQYFDTKLSMVDFLIFINLYFNAVITPT